MSNLKYWPTDSGKVRKDVIEEKLEPLPNLIINDNRMNGSKSKESAVHRHRNSFYVKQNVKHKIVFQGHQI